MAADLCVRLLAADGTDCAWSAGDAASGRGTLAEAAAAAGGRRVVLVVPGTSVLLTEATVPVAQRARARSAIPWALEDRLAADVESLHFALGERTGEGRWPVAVVSRACMDGWLGACRGAGLQPESMIPEPLALPRPAEGEWVALEEDERINVRTGEAAGFACEPGMLATLLAVTEPPRRIRRLGAAGAPWPDDYAGRLAEAEAVGPDPMAGLRPGGAASIELLDGDYSRREQAGRRLRRWRVPAALTALVLAVAGANLALEYAALAGREAELQARLESVFRETFPEVQRVTDPRAQMASRLRSLRSGDDDGGDFTAVLADAGAVLAEREDATLVGLAWRDGRLELDLEADDLQVLDRIRQALVDAGMNAEISTAERTGERIDGRIRVTGEAA